MVAVAALAFVAGACASTKETPNPFNRWGDETPVSDPYRAPLLAAVRSVANPETAVLARYAGDTRLRLDLASLAGETSVTVDLDARLGVINNGSAARRAQVFAGAFPGKTTVLVAELPALQDSSATMTLWMWDARAWECWLPGKVEYITMARDDGHWRVASVDVKEGVSLAQADCE